MLDAEDLAAATDAVLDATLTEGRFAAELRTGIAAATGRDHAVLVGSGSRANLLAVAAPRRTCTSDRCARETRW